MPKDSLCTILRIDYDNNVVHISLINVDINNEIMEISHMPFDYNFLINSLEAFVGIDDDLDIGEIDTLISEWEKDKGGVWGIEVFDAVELTKQTYEDNLE